MFFSSQLVSMFFSLILFYYICFSFSTINFINFHYIPYLICFSFRLPWARSIVRPKVSRQSRGPREHREGSGGAPLVTHHFDQSLALRGAVLRAHHAGEWKAQSRDPASQCNMQFIQTFKYSFKHSFVIHRHLNCHLIMFGPMFWTFWIYGLPWFACPHRCLIAEVSVKF